MRRTTVHKSRLRDAAAANENHLKALKDPPSVLHLTTHGFFLPERQTQTERPLTLSGLALSKLWVPEQAAKRSSMLLRLLAMT